MLLETPDLTAAASAPAFDSAQAEEVARQAIRRNRGLATGLLAGMGVIYLAARLVPHPGFATLLLQAGASAGIVGGCADWFAVTALFRHPFGVPIPHTAILPANKGRIGRALGGFVERNFLTLNVVLPKLHRAHVGQRIAAWLAAPHTAPVISGWLVDGLPHLARAFENRELHRFIESSVGEQISAIDLAPLLGRTMQLLTASGEADVLFDRTIDITMQYVKENRTQFDAIVRQRSRWWIPKTVDQRVASAIFDGASDLLNSLRQENSDVRVRFRAALSKMLDDLINAPDQRAQINAMKNRFLEHPDVKAWLATVWTGFSRLVLEDAASGPQSKTRAALEKAIASLGQALVEDQAMQARIDALLEQWAGQIVAWRGEIGALIAEVVQGWDAHTVSDRLELVIGSDLQYIRMNGTIVGALVGCLIFLVSSMFG